MRGFEPPTPGTTIQCSNQLSYIHRNEESKCSLGPLFGQRTGSLRSYRQPDSGVIRSIPDLNVGEPFVQRSG